MAVDRPLRPRCGGAHDAHGIGREFLAGRSGGLLVEMLIGIALIAIAALEIFFIIRVVQANMGRA